MSQRYRSGKLTPSDMADPDLAAMRHLTSSVLDRYHDSFSEFQIHAALEATWELVSRANVLVEQKAPWKLAKDPTQSERLDGLLYTLAETVRVLALLVSPVVPSASEKILDQLRASDLRKLAWGELQDGHRLGAPSPIFPRAE